MVIWLMILLMMMLEMMVVEVLAELDVLLLVLVIPRMVPLGIERVLLVSKMLLLLLMEAEGVAKRCASRSLVEVSGRAMSAVERAGVLELRGLFAPRRRRCGVGAGVGGRAFQPTNPCYRCSRGRSELLEFLETSLTGIRLVMSL